MPSELINALTQLAKGPENIDTTFSSLVKPLIMKSVREGGTLLHLPNPGNGLTPMHTAALYYAEATDDARRQYLLWTIDLLIKHGAYSSTQDCYGLFPFQYLPQGTCLWNRLKQTAYNQAVTRYIEEQKAKAAATLAGTVADYHAQVYEANRTKRRKKRTAIIQSALVACASAGVGSFAAAAFQQSAMGMALAKASAVKFTLANTAIQSVASATAGTVLSGASIKQIPKNALIASVINTGAEGAAIAAGGVAPNPGTVAAVKSSAARGLTSGAGHAAVNHGNVAKAAGAGCVANFNHLIFFKDIGIPGIFMLPKQKIVQIQ